MATAAQFVTLALGAEVFAIPVELVREILDYTPPSAIPEAPAYVLGLTDVRGRATPTLDLRRKLGMTPLQPTLQTRILVLDVPLEARALSVGLAADRVIEVAAFEPEEIEPAPDIGVRWRSDYIRGVVRRDGQFVVLFEIDRLLTSEDALGLACEQAA